jgi:hypothetical protein
MPVLGQHARTTGCASDPVFFYLDFPWDTDFHFLTPLSIT